MVIVWSYWYIVLAILLIGAIFCALIILEPNMSITICMALLVVVMLFLGGARFKHFLMLSVPAILLVVLLVLTEPYRLKRLIAFADPFASSKNEGFQLVQSLLGISLGGFFGSGLFNSRQKYLFLSLPKYLCISYDSHWSVESSSLTICI